MSLDPAAVRADLCGEVACHLWVEDRCVQVGSHLADYETWPYVSEADSCQTAPEFREESIECSLVCKTSMNLFCTNLIRNLWKISFTSEILNVPD